MLNYKHRQQELEAEAKNARLAEEHLPEKKSALPKNESLLKRLARLTEASPKPAKSTS